MSVPPIIGLIISLSLGLIIGGVGNHFYHKKNLAEANMKQIKRDIKTAKNINVKTSQAKNDNEVIKALEQHKNKPPVIVPKELTPDEIYSLCNNVYLFDNVMQSIRTEAAKAERRIKNLQYDNAAE